MAVAIGNTLSVDRSVRLNSYKAQTFNALQALGMDNKHSANNGTLSASSNNKHLAILQASDQTWSAQSMMVHGAPADKTHPWQTSIG